ncbi:MAG: tRNA (cytidine(56)-2'-O)-methyltransferase [Candidatus Aenigmatarchaeota archaeon]
MIIVLRLGHRLGRDERISTHCGLVARALGADAIIYTGDLDKNMINGLKETTERWGGEFKIFYEKNFRKVIENYKNKNFFIVHLTMYGIPIQNKINEIRKKKKILVIIGSEKVPGDIYQIADMNIAITNQPHSEVAALSIFLHEYFKGNELNKKINKAKIKIVPQEKGKKVIKC